MSIRGYPERYGSGDSFFVLTEADINLPNGKVLEPGPGIAITVIDDRVIIENTGGGGGGSSTIATYITRDDETANLPNSYRIIQGAGIAITYGTNTVTIAAVCDAQSFLTAVTEGTLSGGRHFIVSSPLETIDGGAGNNFLVRIASGENYQTLATTNSSVDWLYGSDVGQSEYSSTGTFVLFASSESVNVVDCSTGPITLNLPDPTTCLNKSFVFKKIDTSGNSVIVDAGSDLIDNQNTFELVVPFSALTIKATMSRWIIT